MKTTQTILKYMFFFFFVALFSGCEDMEDTYKEYAGDGPIRYVGKCSDVKVVPGWNCLRVSWVRSKDPTVEKIKVTCGDFVEFVPADQTEYTITGLGNESYKVTVAGVDADGNESIATEIYERPYTAEHEVVLSMTRVVNKCFLIKNRVAMIFSKWNDGLTDCHIEYTATDGKLSTYPLNDILVQDFKRLAIDDVDTSKPVILKRKGMLADCPDEITFPDVEFTREPVMNSDFKDVLCERYNLTDLTAEWIENVEELEIDRKVSSLEDLLYFPNLKKLSLGKNLFIKAENMDILMGNYLIRDENYKTVGPVEWPLKQMHEMTGLVVDNYGPMLINMNADFVNTIIGAPSVPDLNYIVIDAEKQVVYSNKEAEAEQGIDTHYENLFDQNSKTAWESMNNSMVQDYTFTIDLQEVRALKGVRVMQKDVDLWSTDCNYFPSLIQLQLSDNGEQWRNATVIEKNTLGNSPGETTLIYFLPDSQARYVRFTVSDVNANNEVRCKLADFMLFE